MGHYDSCREADEERRKEERKKWRKMNFDAFMEKSTPDEIDDLLSAIQKLYQEHQDGKLYGNSEQLKAFGKLPRI